jgi:hypothetical protein
VGTDRGVALAGRGPRSQDLADARERVLKVGRLPFEKLTDVRAGCGTGAPERDDVLDLGERQPESPPLTHEGHDSERITRVEAVARWRPTRGRQDAQGLVEAQRLTANAALLRHLPDEQAAPVHGTTIDPAPWGKVKRFWVVRQ